jgi:hypothetical protein
MLKNVLLVIVINVAGCASLPPVPEVVQYGVHADVNPPGFYGVNNKTGARDHNDFFDPEMKGAQCVTNDGYRKYEAWVQQIIEIAEQRCR